MAGTITTSTIQNDTSSPPVFRNNSVEIGTLCRAWVNFNGTGTVAIRASFNVSSITDGGTGIYTVNFTTALPDANYSVSVKSGDTSSGGNYYAEGYELPATSSVRVVTLRGDSWALFDRNTVSVSIFR